MINFFSNYDYFSRELPFKYVHEVEGLDYVRQLLVQDQAIQDLPVVIWPRITPDVPMGPPHVTRLSIQDNCAVFEKELSEGPTFIGRCYFLQIVGEATHENILALILSLPQLSATSRSAEIPDLQALRATSVGRMRQFGGVVQHFDPIWSPDGTELIYTVWEDGRVRLELLNLASRQVQALEPLRGYLAARPLWAPDSRHIVYASLTELKVFDKQTRSTKAVPLSSRGCCESLLFFPPGGTRLIFAYDTNGMADYQIHAYDLVQGTIGRMAVDAPRPKWANGTRRYLDWNLYASPREVPSPTGQYVALITSINGLKRLEVRPKR